MTLPHLRLDRPAGWAGKEWLISNGLGGYASGTLAGGASRRHDGILVAALDAPRGRTVMLDQLEETLLPADGGAVPLFDLVIEFRLEAGLPVWRFKGLGRVIERRLVMPWRQNTVHVQYRLLEGAAVDLRVRPWLHVRHADWGADQPLIKADPIEAEEGRVEIACAPWPVLRLGVAGWRRDWSDPAEREGSYPIETGRGYLDHGPLGSPGTLTTTLESDAALCASTEPWATALALSAEAAWTAEQERRRRLLSRADPALRTGEPALLALAGDAFVFTPRNRPELLARVQAEGDGLCTIVAGYPWFNDWGRDTMIGLEGLTLVTGRWAEARDILRTFARYLKDGLIPDNIPDGPWPPVYHTADATLWFFHALDRYVAHTGDMETLELVLPKLEEVIERHLSGTLYGIGADPEDGLLRAAADGYQLTWMDAIVGDWVVTPRRGKPVEINALWYNALCVMARWLAETGKPVDADRIAAAAERARESFNAKFWYGEGGYLYDVIDGDPAESPLLRPNQMFALSLPNPVLDRARWRRVTEVMRDRLLTPFGLRSLPSDHPAYRGRFDGDQLSRDGAYHQGTVWPFLLGAFVDCWLKVWPDDRAGARAVLQRMLPHLSDYCVGTIAEVFDGDAPHIPRGCTAQGWSVAEWLRAWVACS